MLHCPCRFNLVLVLAMALAACTNAQPEFTTLEGVPQPLYFGKTSHQITVVDPNLDIPVTGSCDPRVTQLEFRIQGYQNWGPASQVASGAVSEDCKTTGTFSFSLKSLSSMGVWNLTQSVRFNLEAKSIYSVGDSQISQLKIEYILPIGTKPGQFRMTQGSATTSSPSFRARSRANFTSGTTATSTSFTVNRQ